MSESDMDKMKSLPEIKWNDEIRLIVADVDETIADVYTPAEPEMIDELNTLLEEGKVVFMVTGASLDQVQRRIINRLTPEKRSQVLVSHCSGAEVWGYKKDGGRNDEPFYSKYDDILNEAQKNKWREVVKQIVEEFDLVTHDTTPVKDFMEKTHNNPLDVMLEDRGPQITLEFVNAYDLTDDQLEQLKTEVPETHGHHDLRIPVMERAEELLKEAVLPITPRLGGIFALDFAIEGVSKTTSIEHVLENDQILQDLGLSKEILENPQQIEVWGDKFSQIRGGTDRHMSLALPKDVRSIDFREEDPTEFPEGYNIVVWDGEKHLHEGLLDYLQSRHE